MHFEMLKAKIKAATISYSIRKNKQNRENINKIQREVEKLTKLVINDPTNTYIVNKLEHEKTKLELDTFHKTRGAQVRSRIRYIADW